MLDNVVMGAAPRAAALMSGMAPSTYHYRMEHDKDFAALVHAAQADAEAPLAQNLHRLGLGNGPQASASALAWLERRSADWQRRDRVEHDIHVEERIDINHILSSPELIAAASAWETAMQAAEDAAEAPPLSAHIVEGDVVEGELIGTVVPELPR